MDITSQHQSIGHTQVSVVRKRKRGLEDSSYQDDIVWTAARCNRLLRTIASRISILNKLLENHSGNRNSYNIGENVTRRKKASGRSVPPDPVWLPTAKKSRAKNKTYARKPKERQAIQSHASALSVFDENPSFPSPLLRRIRNYATDEASHQHNSCILEKGFAKRGPSRQLPVKPKTSAEEAEIGLKKALCNLYQVTGRDSKPARGARSLASTCLRKVPAYIELESEHNDVHDCGSNDLVNNLYLELEEFGTAGGNGWNGLREVVRAHGTSLICNAIGAGILSSHTIEALIQICTDCEAVTDGQAILQAWILSKHALTARQISHTMDEFCKTHHCGHFLFRSLELLGANDPRSLERVIEHASFWDKVMSSAMTEASDAAVPLLSSCLTSSYLPTTTFTQDRNDGETSIGSNWNGATLSLGAIAIATAFVRGNKCQALSLCDLVQRVSTESILSRDIRRATAPDRASSWARAEPFLLTSLVLSGILEDDVGGSKILRRHTLLDMLALIDRNKEPCQRGNVARQLVARVVSLERRLGIDMSRALAARLLALDDEDTATPLRTIALELATAAYHSSQHDPLKTEFDTMASQNTKAGTPLGARVSTDSQAFRWDDGICEWIAATPLKQSKLQTDNACTERVIGRQKPPPVSWTPISDHTVIHMDVVSPDVLAPTPAIKTMQNNAKDWTSFPVKKLRLSVKDPNTCWASQDRPVTKAKVSKSVKFTNRPTVGKSQALASVRTWGGPPESADSEDELGI